MECCWVCFFIIVGKKGKVAEYYKKQERLLEAYNEMETINSMGCLPGRLTEVHHLSSNSS